MKFHFAKGRITIHLEATSFASIVKFRRFQKLKDSFQPWFRRLKAALYNDLLKLAVLFLCIVLLNFKATEIQEIPEPRRLTQMLENQ